ncbi:MAG: hypothetical protein FGM37_02905 [Phycisphaerales bacterium]|nr:hypothetical protein [Phycisphaerales bacterium]
MTMLLGSIALWCAILWPVLRSHAVREAWIGLPRLAQITFACVTAGLLMVQAHHVTLPNSPASAAYPFTPWTMYTAPQDAISYHELLLEYPDGRTTHYPLETLDRRHHRTLLTRIVRDARSTAHAEQLAAGMTELLAVHNRQPTFTPAVAIALWRRTQPLREFSSPEAIPALLVIRVSPENAHAPR